MDEEQVPYGLYECDRCGACCKGTVMVDADYLDTRREPRLLDAEVGRSRLSQQELEEDGKVVLLACGLDKPCSFLGADNECSIYATRPNICVAFEAGCPQCQEARLQLGLGRLPTLLPAADHDTSG